MMNNNDVLAEDKYTQREQTRVKRGDEAYLTAAADVVTPVVGRTFVTSLSHGVGRTDTLTCVSVTVISHMGTLARCETDRNREQVNCGAQLSTCSKCQRRLCSLLSDIRERG